MKLNNALENILIRPVHPDDATDFNEIATHPMVARSLLQLPSKEIGQTEHLLNEHVPGLHRLVAVINDKVIGGVTLNQPQNPRLVHSASLGIMVHPNYWGAGIGTALMDFILDLADNWLNLLRLELSVHPSNSIAVHLYKKFGFELEGTKRFANFAEGKYEDQLLMSRLQSSPPQSKPVEPNEYPANKDVVSIKVRPVKESDAKDLHEMFIHPDVGNGTNQLPSREFSFTNDWLQRQDPGQYRYAAVATHNDKDTKVVGNLTMHQYQKPRLAHAGWFGMSVHPHYWGLGIGSQLMETALDLADNWLGLKRVELEVLTDNLAAIHLYEKFDFELEGTKRLYSFGAGRWADAHFMARLNI